MILISFFTFVFLQTTISLENHSGKQKLSIFIETTIASLNVAVINLLNAESLITLGWKPIVQTYQKKLTKELFSSLDVFEGSSTNLSSFALRTPLARNHTQYEHHIGGCFSFVF